MTVRTPKTIFKSIRRVLTLMRWPSLIVGLILVGAATTHLVAPPRVTAGETVIVDASHVDAEGTNGLMPSVVGLNVDTAQLVFQDAMLTKFNISISSAPGAGAPGRVLAQNPAVGVKVGKTIDLTVSEPVNMPKLVGESYKTARATLEALGAVVQFIQVIKPGSQAGKVLGTEPAVGTTIPAVVKIRVADPGEAVSLTDIEPVGSQECGDERSTNLGETTVSDSVSCAVLEGNTSYVEYEVESKAMTLAFLAGYDIEEGRGTGRIRVIGDGKVLTTVDIATGVKKSNVDISSVRVLRIEVTGKSEDSANPARLVLGAAKFQGAPEGIAELVEGN